MDTSVNSGYVSAPTAISHASTNFSLTAFFALLEKNRFGVIPTFLVFAACLGGFAAAVAVKYSLFMLAVIGLSTGLVEVMLIAVTPMRITFWFLVAALIIDLFVFIF